MEVLVAGATGALGREVVGELARRGHTVRALVRDPARAAGLPVAQVVVGDARSAGSLRGACDGVDAVFSCVGASVDPDPRRGRETFGVVDVEANRNLLEVAKASPRRPRFVYVSVFGADRHPELDYMRAHHRVEEEIAASGLPHAFVRPTGFFSALAFMVDAARKGPLVDVDGGGARSNPIHDADLAIACVDAIEGAVGTIDVGGPDVLTRHEMAQLAFDAVGKPGRFRAVPAWVLRAFGLLARPLHPRLSHLIAFLATVTSKDCVAPPRGDRRLRAFFEERARAGTSPARE